MLAVAMINTVSTFVCINNGLLLFSDNVTETRVDKSCVAVGRERQPHPRDLQPLLHYHYFSFSLSPWLIAVLRRFTE